MSVAGKVMTEKGGDHPRGWGHSLPPLAHSSGHPRPASFLHRRVQHPPCACTQGHIPCPLCPRALHLRQGCSAGPAFLLPICSKSLTNHWLATWTWSLLCVMYGWVGGWNRNLYWGAQSYFTGEGSYDSWIGFSLILIKATTLCK